MEELDVTRLLPAVAWMHLAMGGAWVVIALLRFVISAYLRAAAQHLSLTSTYDSTGAGAEQRHLPPGVAAAGSTVQKELTGLRCARRGRGWCGALTEL
jgi:hypothetical protein